MHQHSFPNENVLCCLQSLDTFVQNPVRFNNCFENWLFEAGRFSISLRNVIWLSSCDRDNL